MEFFKHIFSNYQDNLLGMAFLKNLHQYLHPYLRNDFIRTNKTQTFINH